MKFNFRVSVKKLIKMESAVVVAMIFIATTFPATREFTLIIAGMCLAHIPLYAPVGFLNGFSFVMYDAPPDAPVKNYYFFSIFLAAFIGTSLYGTLDHLSDSLRTLLIG